MVNSVGATDIAPEGKNGRGLATGKRAALIAVVVLLLSVAGATIWLIHQASERRRDLAMGADGCGAKPLAENFSDLKSKGASLILARSDLTGRRVKNGVSYFQVKLTSVQVLAGPQLANGTTAWVAATMADSAGGPDPSIEELVSDPGPLWGPTKRIFGVAMPPSVTGEKLGMLLRQAPIVGDEVILSESGCMVDESLSGRPFNGRLEEIPGTNAYRLLAESPAGLNAVPLRTLVDLAKD